MEVTGYGDRCVGMGMLGWGWVGGVLDKWHSLNAYTHYMQEYRMLNSISSKSGLSEIWENTLQLRILFIIL